MTVETSRVRNVVLTRSKEGNEVLATELRRLGFNPISVETISFLPPKSWSRIDESLKELHSFDWLVLTSATGVDFFSKRMKELSLPTRWRGRPRAAAVGDATASALSKTGVEGIFKPSSYLTKTLARELPLEDGPRVLLLRADIADPAMSEELRSRGFEVTEHPIYTTSYAGGEVPSDADAADLIVFASPSSVRGFCRRIQASRLQKLLGVRVACIGPVTATAARELGFRRITMSKSQSFDSVVAMIVEMNRDG